MVLSLEWSKSAVEGLEKALDFIAFDHPAAAQKLWRQANAATRELRTFPMKGRMVPEYQDPSVREIIVRPFRIIYTTRDPACIQILAAIRCERMLPEAEAWS